MFSYHFWAVADVFVGRSQEPERSFRGAPAASLGQAK